jgi:hypothetical protein
MHVYYLIEHMHVSSRFPRISVRGAASSNVPARIKLASRRLDGALDDHWTRMLQSMACPLSLFSFIDYLYFRGAYQQSGEAIDDSCQA